MAPEIVFLHGFTHTGASWDAVIGRLGQRYRASAPDLPGHGTAADPPPGGFEAAVAELASAAPERLVLAGYSMGARLALALAAAEPLRVERLFLVSGTAGIADEIERQARRDSDDVLAAEIEAGSIEDFARRWGAQPLFKGQPPAVAETAHADRLRSRPRGLAAALRALGTGAMAPLWTRLGELAMPVTVVVGERDAKFRKLGERLAAGAPDGEVLVVPATGHAVHLEAPGIVAAIIEERLAASVV